MEETEDKKIVVKYERVSSAEQKKEGISLKAQDGRLEEYAESNNWEVYKTYIDAGVSGKSIQGRKQFKAMIQDAKNKKFSAILITKFDRAFRNVKDALITLDELNNIGVDFISINEHIDTTTAMGKFFFTIISALAELERELTSERVNAVLYDRFNDGWIVGKLPVGYRHIFKNKKDKKGVIGIELDPKKVDIIKDVFFMTSLGKNYKEICKKHNLGMTTYYKILKNKVYIGIIKYKDKEKKGIHTPLITPEIFYKVNPTLKENE